MHQYAADRSDKRDTEELRGFAKTICGRLLDIKTPEAVPRIPGNRPCKRGTGLVPKTAKKCVNSGPCAEICPAQAISRGNLRTADSTKCISCMRCVVRCPKSARKVNGIMVSVAALAMKKSLQ